MQKQSEPTSSTLQLVANDMTDIMETLDTRELDLGDGEYDTADAHVPGVCACVISVVFIRHQYASVFLMCVCFCWCFSAAEHLPFTAIYHTVGFKESEAEVFQSSPITAKILEVERFTSAQDRFNVTTQRSVNKVRGHTQLPVFMINLQITVFIINC